MASNANELGGRVPAEGVPADADAAADPAVAPAAVAAGAEAILIVADGAVPVGTFATAIGCGPTEVLAALSALREHYAATGRGLRLRETAGGWQFFAAPEHAALVQRAVLDTAPARLTQAALETLAVVAYQQPVSRGRVAGVRGVNVDAVMRTLVARGLVTEVGQDPGSGALLYGTTETFLDKLGIVSLDELPPLAPLLPDVDTFDDLEANPQRESET